MGYFDQIGAKLSATLKNAQGKKHDNSAQQAAAAANAMQSNENDQYGRNKGYSDLIRTQDKNYLNTMHGNVNKYESDLNGLRGQVEQAQTDASNTYSNDIQPRMKNLMETAQKNSASAMSLKDAMDPNNAVATGTRALYDAQGNKVRDAYNEEGNHTRTAYNTQGTDVQNQYEKQAQNEGRQGLADVGVLSALGMQNMAGQLGNVPMSGGQLQALMGANQAQSGSAYAGTQRRQQSLRDQGISSNIGLQNKGLDMATDLRGQGLGRQSDLGAQGINQGFARSDVAYGQGQQALQDYGQSVGNYEGANDRQMARDRDFRNQIGGYAGQTYGLNQQMNDATRGVNNAGTMRDMSIYNTHMGGNQANLGATIAGINAGNARDAAVNTGAMQAVGTAAGAYFGGPAGAAAGNQAGAAAGAAAAPTPAAVPSYGSYNQPGNYVSQSSQNPPQQGMNLYGDDTVANRMRG